MAKLLTKTCEYAVIVAIEDGKKIIIIIKYKSSNKSSAMSLIFIS
jgi:mRNA-degrading endonuclease RelE of RelBE toxin-antitoxin system